MSALQATIVSAFLCVVVGLPLLWFSTRLYERRKRP